METVGFNSQLFSEYYNLKKKDYLTYYHLSNTRMDFIAIDFETANHNRSSACQVGLAKVVNRKIVNTKSFFIKPEPNYYEPINVRIHGIDERKTDHAPSFSELWESELKDYLSGSVLIAHNAPFEKSVFNALSRIIPMEVPEIYDTLRLSRFYCCELLNFGLDSVCEHFNIPLDKHHDAESDAVGCAQILLSIQEQEGIDDIEVLYDNTYSAPLANSGRVSGSDLFRCAEMYKADEDSICGKAFCITGKLSYIRRDVAKEVIESAGGIFKTSLSSKVDYLVVGDLTELGHDSEKLKKVKDYREKGYRIEVLTEAQFQELVSYEGKKITFEMIEHDSKELLDSNRCNMLYGKNVCISEGFSMEVWNRLSHLGIISGVSFWPDEAATADYYIMSNTILEQMKTGVKSKLVIRMEDAMNKQANPEGNPDNHHIKFISEDAIMAYLEMRDNFVQGKTKMKVQPGEEPHFVCKIEKDNIQ